MQLWNTETNTWNDTFSGILAMGAMFSAMGAVFAIAYEVPIAVILINLCLTFGLMAKIQFAGGLGAPLCMGSFVVTVAALYQIFAHGEYQAPVGLFAFVMLIANGYAFVKKEVR